MNGVKVTSLHHHQRMDSMLDPISGKPMKRSDHEEWWERIKKGAGIMS